MFHSVVSNNKFYASTRNNAELFVAMVGQLSLSQHALPRTHRRGPLKKQSRAGSFF